MARYKKPQQMRELKRKFKSLSDHTLNPEDLPRHVISMKGADYMVLKMLAKRRGWTMTHALHVLITYGVKYLCATAYDRYVRRFLSDLLNASLSEFPRPDLRDFPRR
jgi:hypothetical protein